MFNETDLRRMVRGIYDAAYDSNAWTACFADMGRVLSAPIAGFVCIPVDDAYTSISLFTGVDDTGINEYVQHYAARNEWTRRWSELRGSPLAGDVVVDRQLLGMDELRKTEFYNDFLVRYGCTRSIAACTAAGETTSYLSLMRPEKYGDWPDWAAGLMRELVPHLQCAVAIHRQVSFTAHQKDLYGRLLDGFAAPVIVVNEQRKILAANSAGQRILNASDGLTDRDGRLEAIHVDDQTSLARAIAGAIHARHEPWKVAPRWAQVRRTGQKRPFRLLAAPPDAKSVGRFAVLFIIDAPRPSVLASELLMSLYGLTAAEARVAVLTSAGGGAHQVARDTGAAPETVRKHLRRIFQKTKTTSQPDLGWLVGTLPK